MEYNPVYYERIIGGFMVYVWERGVCSRSSYTEERDAKAKVVREERRIRAEEGARYKRMADQFPSIYR